MTSDDPIDRDPAVERAAGGNRREASDASAIIEDAVVRQWMQQFAALPLPESRLPEAQLLWWKAELLRRWDEERRALAPIERAEPITVSIGVIGALILMLTLWQSAPGPTATLIFATAAGLAALVGIATMMLRQPRS
jgi:hypothetical protein